jgi:flagellar protein FliT
MMTSQEVVTVYEAMMGITEQMVQAAESGDWDLLVALEQQCAAYTKQLKDSEQPLALVGANRERKVAAIRQMLDDDRKIRDLTTPWMAQLSALISNSGNQRRVAHAYGG